MNKVTKNIIANYLGKLWGFVSIFVFVRFYIEILGIESYAIINFYTVILGLLAFADAGLTATLTRELARDISSQEKLNLVYTFERIYIFICVLVATILILSSNIIANNFLSSETYTPDFVSSLLKLIGVGIALQLFSTLFEGGLNGLQQQVLTNKVRIIWSLFRSGVVLIPIYFLPKLEIYFWWQIFCNIGLLLVFRKALYSYLPNINPIFSVELIRSTGMYALGMMGIAFISAINIQLDKLVTSKYFTLEQFGYYSIASTLAQLPTMIVIPIIIAVFPLLTQFISQNNIEETKKTFHKYSFLTSSIAAPIVCCIALYSVPIVTLWTGKQEIAQATDYIVKILVVGGLFLCLQLTPFYLALANGFTKINLFLGFTCLIIIIPLMIFSIKNYGMIGAAIPWLFVNLVSFIVMGIYVTRKFLTGNVVRWLLIDVFLPVLIAFFVGFIVFKLSVVPNFQYSFIIESIIIGFTSFIINIIIYNRYNPSNILFNFDKLNSKRSDS